MKSVEDALVDYSPTIKDMVLSDDCTGTVLVPWRIFHSVPEVVSWTCASRDDGIFIGDDINVMFESPRVQAAVIGEQDEFNQTWIIHTETHQDLQNLIWRLETRTSLVHVTLEARKVFSTNIKIPAILALTPSSRCMTKLIESLEEAKAHLLRNKRFSVELDLGPSVTKWAENVLQCHFVCLGGRVCVTNGKNFNHGFDWSNVLGCVPCLPCCFIGSSIYRITRKLQYHEVFYSNTEDVLILGSQGQDNNKQLLATFQLMTWYRDRMQSLCITCGYSQDKNSFESKRCMCFDEKEEEPKKDNRVRLSFDCTLPPIIETQEYGAVMATDTENVSDDTSVSTANSERSKDKSDIHLEDLELKQISEIFVEELQEPTTEPDVNTKRRLSLRERVLKDAEETKATPLMSSNCGTALARRRQQLSKYKGRYRHSLTRALEDAVGIESNTMRKLSLARLDIRESVEDVTRLDDRRHSTGTTDLRHSTVTTERRHSTGATKRRHGRVTVDRRHSTITTGHSTVTTDRRYSTGTTDRKHSTSTADRRHSTGTTSRRYSTGTTNRRNLANVEKKARLPEPREAYTKGVEETGKSNLQPL